MQCTQCGSHFCWDCLQVGANPAFLMQNLQHIVQRLFASGWQSSTLSILWLHFHTPTGIQNGTFIYLGMIQYGSNKYDCELKLAQMQMHHKLDADEY